MITYSENNRYNKNTFDIGDLTHSRYASKPITEVNSNVISLMRRKYTPRPKIMSAMYIAYINDVSLRLKVRKIQTIASTLTVNGKLC